MRRALGLALAVMVLLPAPLASAAEEHATVVSDQRWCAKMLPGRQMVPARRRCLAFLEALRADSLGARDGVPVDNRAVFILPDVVIAALVWGGAESLDVEGTQGIVTWGDAAGASTPPDGATPIPGTATAAPSPSPSPIPEPTPTPAAGAMRAWSDDASLRYRPLEATDEACDYGISCSYFLVRATDGCPTGLYAEVQLLDGTGSVVGRTNARVGALTAGQQAKLVFHLFAADVETVQLSEMTCY
jgi:hypothetical protein